MGARLAVDERNAALRPAIARRRLTWPHPWYLDPSLRTDYFTSHVTVSMSERYYKR